MMIETTQGTARTSQASKPPLLLGVESGHHWLRRFCSHCQKRSQRLIGVLNSGRARIVCNTARRALVLSLTEPSICTTAPRKRARAASLRLNEDTCAAEFCGASTEPPSLVEAAS